MGKNEKVIARVQTPGFYSSTLFTKPSLNHAASQKSIAKILFQIEWHMNRITLTCLKSSLTESIV